MSDSTIAKFSRNTLLFLGGVAVGYSIKLLMEDESFDQIKYSIYEMFYTKNNDNDEYIDVDVEVKD